MRVFGAPLRFSALLLLVTVLAACGTPEEKAAQHYERALEHVEAGDDARAMAELRNVLRLDPKHADAMYQFGLIHERAERWPQAIRAFEEAAAERPGFIEANMRLGRLGLRWGDVPLAERAAAAILAAHPDNTDALLLDAAVMLRQGDLQRAQNIAETVLVDDPRREDAIAVSLGVLSARGRFDEALAGADAALLLVPESVSLRMIKAVLLEQRGDVDGVRAVYREIIDLDPQELAYRQALSGYLVRSADVEGAEAVLRDALEEVEGAAPLGEMLVALVYRERGAAAAEAELRHLIADRPDHHRFRFGLADMLIQADRPAEAEEVLLELIEGADPDTAHRALATVAEMRLAREDLAGARELTDAVLAEDGDHPLANVVRAELELEAGETDEAVRRGRTALRRDPTFMPALRLLARAHLAKGETDLAVGALSEVLALAPRDARSAEMLAILLTERGDLDAALRAWDVVAEQGQDPRTALAARARIRIEQANWMQAQLDLERLTALPDGEGVAAVLAGQLEFARGRYEQSREWFERALEAGAGGEDPLIGIVRSYVAENDAEAALALLQARTAVQPDDAVAFHLMADLLASQGRWAEAVTALETSIDLAPDRLLAHLHLGLLQQAPSGSLDAAVAVYQRGLETFPDNPALLYDLAFALRRGERFDAAIDIYRRLADLRPDDDLAANNFAALVADHAYDDPAALEQAYALAQRFATSNLPVPLDTLGWVHFRKGDYATAQTYLERAVALRDDDPELRYHLAMTLLAGGDKARATDEFRRAVVEGAAYHGLAEAQDALARLEAEAAAGAGG